MPWLWDLCQSSKLTSCHEQTNHAPLYLNRANDHIHNSCLCPLHIRAPKFLALWISVRFFFNFKNVIDFVRSRDSLHDLSEYRLILSDNSQLSALISSRRSNKAYSDSSCSASIKSQLLLNSFLPNTKRCYCLDATFLRNNINHTFEWPVSVSSHRSFL